MTSKTLGQIIEEAREGCHGDVDSALDHVRKEVEVFVQDMINVVVDHDLTNEFFLIGLNPLGNVVMACSICDETFNKNIGGKTLKQLIEISRDHRCVAVAGKDQPLVA